jgi:hypothetical protein
MLPAGAHYVKAFGTLNAGSLVGAARRSRCGPIRSTECGAA